MYITMMRKIKNMLWILESPIVCRNLIFDLWLWIAYVSVSLTLGKLFSRSSFYDIACFTLLADIWYLDYIITSENIFRRSSIDADILQDFYSRCKIPPIILRLNSCLLWYTMRNVSEAPALIIGTFQKAQREVIFFPFVVRKNEKLP